VLDMETNLGVSGKLPGLCGFRFSCQNDRREQTRHERSGIVVKFRRSYIEKDTVRQAHHEAEFSLLLISTQHESAGRVTCQSSGCIMSAVYTRHAMRPQGTAGLKLF